MDELGEPRASLYTGYVVNHPVSMRTSEAYMTDACRFLPLIPNLTRPAPYDKTAIENGKATSLSMLVNLENLLKDRRFLVGEWVTLADIFVAIYVSRGLEWVLDEQWRSSHPAIMRHFAMIRDWAPVKKVVRNFVLVKEETPNVNPYD
ncbi:MAG: hypothetical protein Q9179_004084 [Wetmoreana sp. 5 TL-2023]